MTKIVIFSRIAEKDIKTYKHNKQTAIVARIWELINDIDANGEIIGIGSPERLYRQQKYMGWYSRKIEIDGKDTFNRLVYTVTEDLIIILECKGHYGEKIDI